MLMVAAPCLVAMRSSREVGDFDDFVPEDYEADELVPEAIAPEEFDWGPSVPVAAHPSSSGARSAAQRANAQSLRDMAVEAEIEALMAKDRADRAHWEALTAAARAASLRA